MMPWYPDAFLGATLGWNWKNRAIYRALLDAQWLLETLPSEEADLAAIVGCTVEELRASWAQAGLKFSFTPDGRLVNERLEEHRAFAFEKHHQAVEKGRLGGNTRAERAKEQAGLKLSLKPSLSPGSSSASAQVQAGLKHLSLSESGSGSVLTLVPKDSPPTPDGGSGGNPERAAPLVLHDSLPQIPWREWLEHRRVRRWPVDRRTLQKQLNTLAPFDSAIQTRMIDDSINAGWQGIFAPKGTGGAKKPFTPPRSVAQMEADEEANNAKR